MNTPTGLEWAISAIGNFYVYRTRTPRDYVDAMITIKVPHELYIYINNTFVLHETSYDDLETAKAVALALVAMENR